MIINQMARDFSTIPYKELALNAAVLAVIFKIIWTFFSEVFNRVREWLSREIKHVNINLGSYHEYLVNKAHFKCLIVRYGTDQYLGTLASDYEKFTGRLRNKEIPIKIEGSEDVRLILRLPVHRRIGTQFKCYVDVVDNDSVQFVKSRLMDCAAIEDISESSSPNVNRFYFLISNVGTAVTVDGIKNNMFFPK